MHLKSNISPCRTRTDSHPGKTDKALVILLRRERTIASFPRFWKIRKFLIAASKWRKHSAKHVPVEDKWRRWPGKGPSTSAFWWFTSQRRKCRNLLVDDFRGSNSTLSTTWRTPCCTSASFNGGQALVDVIVIRVSILFFHLISLLTVPTISRRGSFFSSQFHLCNLDLLESKINFHYWLLVQFELIWKVKWVHISLRPRMSRNNERRTSCTRRGQQINLLARKKANICKRFPRARLATRATATLAARR